MGMDGGTGRLWYTMRLNHSRTRIPSPFLFISGFSLLEAFSDNLIIGDRHTKEARGFDVQGNPQVVSANDSYSCFTYPHAARS